MIFFIQSFIHESDDLSTLNGSYAYISKVGLMSCLLTCVILPNFMDTTRNAFRFLTSGCAVLFGGMIPLLIYRLKREPVTWLLGSILSHSGRFRVFLAWILCVLTAVVFVSTRKTKSTTIERKFFHLVVSAVVLTGIGADQAALTHLASIVALCVFIVLESLRLYRVEPFASGVSAAFEIFLDEKDSGALILTHVYLLVGCCLPLWLNAKSKLQTLSGVLAIGVGDTAASVFGSKFGRTKFADSNKTVEGFIASFFAQWIFLWLLVGVGFLTGPENWVKVCVPVFLVSLIEALTEQVDNLVLPLILYCLL